jgi:hypothetical protein
LTCSTCIQENVIKMALVIGKHKTDKATLETIYQKFEEEWLPNKGEGNDFPEIMYGPKTIGISMFHKVLFIVDGSDLQIRNLTNLLYGYMSLEVHRLYEIMSKDEVDALPQHY